MKIIHLKLNNYKFYIKKYIILLTDANYKNGTSVDSGATLTDEIKKLVEEGAIIKTGVGRKTMYMRNIN